MLPTILFVTFTFLAALGAFLIGRSFHSRRAGVVAGVTTLAFFLGLYGFVRWLMSSAGAL